MLRGVAATLDERMQGFALGVNEFFTLGARAVRFFVSRPFYVRDVFVQMDRVGVGSLPIIVLTGVFSGMVLALQGAEELGQFGAASFLGSLVGASMVRELGPVLTGLGVAGRVGSSIAAELGSMRAGEQIDALQTFGTDPIRKLVTPRLLACLVMVPVLTIVMDTVAIIGGMLIAKGAGGVSPQTFLTGMWSSFAYGGFIFGVLPRDFFGGLLKPFVFGAVIALVGSYQGLNVKGGAESVGLATTRAVVVSSVIIFALDYFITQLLLVFLGPPS